MPETRWDAGVRSLESGGAPGDPAAVLVPGLGALGYLLDTWAGCAGWARSFLVDVPGFGHDRRYRCAAEIPAIAAAVQRWIDVVPGDEPVVLAGHSTGAQAALRVAARAPDRVRALVLMGPTFPPRQRRFSGLLRGFASSAVHEPPGLQPVTVPYYARGGAVEVARFLRSAQRDEPERTITGVRCPTLLVRGEHDAFAPAEWLDRLAAACPSPARTVTVPGAHAFPFRRGGLTSALIASAARSAGPG